MKEVLGFVPFFTRPEGMSQEEFESQLGTSFEMEMENFKKAIESLTF